MNPSKALLWSGVVFVLCCAGGVLFQTVLYKIVIVQKMEDMTAACENQLLDSQIKYDIIDTRLRHHVHNRHEKDGAIFKK